ncbi:MAG: TAT-variant-translocated molybdopterin oxidoreductase [Acidobacteria bacterium]|nr:TAT-variant-translocated molybdopterin oxidoreductase [Acidobacteriota bacterium]
MKEQQKQYWRSLDQLSDAPEYRKFVEREFPEGASELNNEVDRRKFLILAAAGIGMAGLTACRRPIEKIIPAGGKVTEQLIPGVPQQYATIFNFGGQAQGLLVRSNDGRPTKIEGNPNHPASLGATSGYAQASILDLYDPDRSKSVKQGKENKSWDDFVKAATPLFAELKGKQGDGLRILAESSSSPALRELRTHITTAFPQAKWHTYDAISQDNALEGANLAFGQPVHAHYAFDRADVVLALDSDFLGSEIGSTANVKGFSKKRRTGTDVEASEGGHGAAAAHGEPKAEAEHKTEAKPAENKTEAAKAEAAKPAAAAETAHSADSGKMNRLYAVESNFTVTGAMADHRLRLQSSKIGGFLAALAKQLGITANGLDKHAASIGGNALATKWVAAVAKDLTANKGKAVVVVGSRQPAHIHALAHLINASVAGDAVRYTRAFDEKFESGLGLLKSLVADASGGKVNTLVILGGNPVYNTPADLKFRDALKQVKNKIHVGLYQDETSVECDWHVNEAHYLESWGDGRAFDGTASIQQPLIAPLHNGKSAIEVLAAVSDYPQKSGYDIVKTLWLKSLGGEKAWNKAVHDGVIPNTAFAAVTPAANAGAIGGALDAAQPAGDGLEINFVQDPSMYDGRFANNGWMQEAPDPMTKLVWDNAALMSKDTAEKLGVSNEDVVKLSIKGHELRLPVWILPGHAKDSISVALGYGRTETGRIGKGYDTTFGKLFDANSFGNTIGGNTYLLRTSDAMDFALGVTVAKTGETHKIAVTQDHWSMEDRPLVREATLDDFIKKPAFAKEPDGEQHMFSIFDHPWDFKEGNQWGMAIDLNTCVGCNACVLACQSENNIPIVGKDNVLRGREMHWIRMDRYFTNIPATEFAVGGAKPSVFNEDHMQAVQQPMTCQQCEHAPCEEVCPVAATVHNEEGLNTMAYNRCVGTRYCSNNCPFKVRRFNYLNWHKDISETEKMQQNPEVTVRMRGVMEKCTYCTQRISAAKHQAKVEGHRPIKDGEITPACAQVCPADAIVFGNINDPNSRVSKLRKQARNYQLLVELNINPRTTYLAKLRNINKELEA